MVHFIGAGPGAEDLITVRGAKLLGEADVIIYAGSLVNPRPAQLQEGELRGVRQRVHDPGAGYRGHEGHRGPGRHDRPAPHRRPLPLRRHPGADGRAGQAGRRLRRDPGVSSFSGAAAALCAEYTLPEVSQSVIITRMAGRTPVPEGEELRKMASHGCTMVLFLSTGLLEDVEQELAAGGYAPDTPAAIVYKATWPEQRVYRCTVSTLAKTARENQVTKTALITIGHFLGDDYERSKLYDPTFTHEFREASK